MFRPLRLRSHYRNTWPPKRKNADDTSLTAKQLRRFEKGRQRSPEDPPGGGGYLGPRIQFSFQSSYVHMDLMVLAQSLDNFIVPKSAQL